MPVCMNLWCVNGFWRFGVTCLSAEAKLAAQSTEHTNQHYCWSSFCYAAGHVKQCCVARRLHLQGRRSVLLTFFFLNAKSSEKCSSSARREGNRVESTDQVMIPCCGTNSRNVWFCSSVALKIMSLRHGKKKKLQVEMREQGALDCCVWLNSNSYKQI